MFVFRIIPMERSIFICMKTERAHWYIVVEKQKVQVTRVATLNLLPNFQCQPPKFIRWFGKSFMWDFDWESLQCAKLFFSPKIYRLSSKSVEYNSSQTLMYLFHIRDIFFYFIRNWEIPARVQHISTPSVPFWLACSMAYSWYSYWEKPNGHMLHGNYS